MQSKIIYYTSIQTYAHSDLGGLNQLNFHVSSFDINDKIIISMWVIHERIFFSLDKNMIIYLPNHAVKANLNSQYLQSNYRYLIFLKLNFMAKITECIGLILYNFIFVCKASVGIRTFRFRQINQFLRVKM